MLWAYRDVTDREQRRARLVEDPARQDYLERSLPMIQQQESRILRPTAFSRPSPSRTRPDLSAHHQHSLKYRITTESI
ncbi:NIPSNAP family protein [Arthrobacter sp. MI7-26]|uniref:NIPSNAP family protein n=1 Tax=Arthrobacter sp. MI7-26 TaxID=2993653 RepID=UPI003A599A6E